MIIDNKGRPLCAYNHRSDFAYFAHGDTTVGYQCPAGAGSESMDRYVWERKRNIGGDRLRWASRPDEMLQERVLFMRDPLSRLEGSYKFHRWMEECPAVMPEHTLAQRLRGKANLADDKEFVDLVLSTVQGYPEVIHETWVPLSELYRHRVSGDYVPTQHKRINDVASILPGFPHVATQRPEQEYAFDGEYRRSELESYYSDDIAAWNAIQ